MNDLRKLKIATAEMSLGMVQTLLDSTKKSLIRKHQQIQLIQKQVEDFGVLLDELEKREIVLKNVLTVLRSWKVDEILWSLKSTLN